MIVAFELVEAGGVEPPSESVQRKASPCTASVLFLAPLYSQRQDYTSADPEKIRLTPAGYRHETIPLNGASSRPAGESGRDDGWFTQPQRIHNRWRLCL